MSDPYWRSCCTLSDGKRNNNNNNNMFWRHRVVASVVRHVPALTSWPGALLLPCLPSPFPTFVHRSFPYTPPPPISIPLVGFPFPHSTCCPPSPNSLGHHAWPMRGAAPRGTSTGWLCSKNRHTFIIIIIRNPGLDITHRPQKGKIYFHFFLWLDIQAVETNIHTYELTDRQFCSGLRSKGN